AQRGARWRCGGGGRRLRGRGGIGGRARKSRGGGAVACGPRRWNRLVLFDPIEESHRASRLKAREVVLVVDLLLSHTACGCDSRACGVLVVRRCRLVILV